eukprot:COSAG03_NODE_720_length_6108_cov_5.664170_6_plen_160_part_00
MACKIRVAGASGGFRGEAAVSGKLDGAICAKRAMGPADEASGSGAPRGESGAACRAEQRAGKSRSRHADGVRIRRAARCACRRNPGRAAPGSSVADIREAPLSVRGTLLAPPGRPGAARPDRHRQHLRGCAFVFRPHCRMFEPDAKWSEIAITVLLKSN